MFRKLTFAIATLATMASSFTLNDALADIVPFNAMLRGINMTPAQCATMPQGVWVTALGHGYCIRYYMSNAGGEGNRPLVFLEGDQMGSYNHNTDEFSKSSGKDTDTDKLAIYADNLSKRMKTTAIYLARVGVDGSSGRESVRHSIVELAAINAALDAIKRRHGFAGFHLVGQSGGAGLVGGLIGKRQDIGCAVPGAGRLAVLDSKATAGPPERARFDAVRDVAQVVRNGARILVITDPADKRVPEKHQTTFVNAVRAAGGQIEQHFVQAQDDDHHGVTPYAIYAAAECIAGARGTQIAQGLSELGARRFARAQQRQSGMVTASNVPAPPVSAPPAPRTHATQAAPSGATVAAYPSHAPAYAPTVRYSPAQSNRPQGYAPPSAHTAPTIPYPGTERSPSMRQAPAGQYRSTQRTELFPARYASSRPSYN